MYYIYLFTVYTVLYVCVSLSLYIYNTYIHGVQSLSKGLWSLCAASEEPSAP